MSWGLNGHPRGRTGDAHINRVNTDEVLLPQSRSLGKPREKVARIDGFEDRLAALEPEVGPADD